MNIKLVIFDVDGVLTDGKLYFSAQGDTLKAFNTQDGLGIKMLMSVGIQTAIISGRTSDIVKARAKELGITYLYEGCVNKVTAFEECLKAANLTPEQTAYMGDDINDLPVLRKVALSAAPPNAIAEVLKAVTFITECTGGDGAARELCEFILKSQCLWDEAIKPYGH